MSTPRWMTILLLGLFVLGGGCELFNGDDDDDDDLATTSSGRYDDRYDGRYDERARGDVVIGRQQDATVARYPDGRSTRWPDNGNRIPAGAGTVGEMDGADMTFRARQDGQLFVFDNTDERVIWSGRIRDGDRFVLRPGQHEATVNGRPVDLPRLGSGHGFSLYFLPE